MLFYNERSVRIVKCPDTITCKDTAEGARNVYIRVRNGKKEDF